MSKSEGIGFCILYLVPTYRRGKTAEYGSIKHFGIDIKSRTRYRNVVLHVCFVGFCHNGNFIFVIVGIYVLAVVSGFVKYVESIGSFLAVEKKIFAVINLYFVRSTVFHSLPFSLLFGSVYLNYRSIESIALAVYEYVTPVAGAVFFTVSVCSYGYIEVTVAADDFGKIVGSVCRTGLFLAVNRDIILDGVRNAVPAESTSVYCQIRGLVQLIKTILVFFSASRHSNHKYR